MDMLAEWLPRVGAVLTLILGVSGFLKPHTIAKAQGLESISDFAASEIRVVFGVFHLGYSLVALAMHDPNIYLAIGCAWLAGLLSRGFSYVWDKLTIKELMPAIVVDGGLAFLFLSPFIF